MQDPNEGAADERRVRLGDAIRRFRNERTQAEFGTLFGVPQTTVSRWEAGHVDLSFEQVRSIEVALDVPLGTLGRAAGFVVSSSTADEDEFIGFRTTYFNTFNEVQAELAAAEVIGLGVRLSNRWIPSREHSGSELEWVLTLMVDPPGDDD
ncbi:MAG: helix-turn-helix protein [Actinomycetota bacterium]|jgi:transcriptional regulator with XRE-family HTH domain